MGVRTRRYARSMLERDPNAPHRVRYEGHNEARFLTCSCFGRRPLLNSDRSRRWLVDAIVRARERHGFHLWSWVVMPEHFHLLIYQARGASAVSATLKTIKQSVVTNAINWLRREGLEVPRAMRDRRPDGRVVTRFWLRGGGYDRNLWSAEEVWEKVRYIHKNPVERGLCSHAVDWGWSSARVYEGMEGVLSLDLEFLPEDPSRDGR